MPAINRILTTHVGSLIRPPGVLAILDAVERGEEIDEATRESTLAHAVVDLVRQQVDAGIDVVSDGEVGKVNWISYLYERLSGLEVRERKPGTPFMPPSRDRQQFADFYAEDDRQSAASIKRVAFLGEKGVRSRRGIVPWAKLRALADGAALATREQF